jgi:mRNA-degrading endonuclease toxin of MazEF toxin-antitoxin module
VAGPGSRRVLIYSGDMFNDLADVPYVITMEVVDRANPLEVVAAGGTRIAYTRLDHVPKTRLTEQLGEVSATVMETINRRLFMVITTN